jgi:hypothetical protein
MYYLEKAPNSSLLHSLICNSHGILLHLQKLKHIINSKPKIYMFRYTHLVISHWISNAFSSSEMFSLLFGSVEVSKKEIIM